MLRSNQFTTETNRVTYSLCSNIISFPNFCFMSKCKIDLICSVASLSWRLRRYVEGDIILTWLIITLCIIIYLYIYWGGLTFKYLDTTYYILFCCFCNWINHYAFQTPSPSLANLSGWVCPSMAAASKGVYRGQWNLAASSKIALEWRGIFKS